MATSSNRQATHRRARAITSLLAAGALAAIMAIPALAAAPTFSGPIVCANNGGGSTTFEDEFGQNLVVGSTKKEINQIKRSFLGDDPLDCLNRKSIDDSGVTQDV